MRILPKNYANSYMHSILFYINQLRGPIFFKAICCIFFYLLVASKNNSHFMSARQ